jgi:RimJ/RimL family protein N-acetyltransferase
MRIRLDSIEAHDLPLLKEWRNELMEAGYVRQWRYLNLLNQEDWFIKISTTNEDLMLKVLDEDDKIIGVVGLCYIDWVRRKAEASIYLGEKSVRGKGYGKEALLALVGYGFARLGLNRIWAEIFINNPTSTKLFESCGFVYEGTFRQSHFCNGKWVDSRIYSMLLEEWEKRRDEVSE